MMKRDPTIFRQTLYVLVGALLLAHFVVFIAIVLVPPTESSAISTEDIVRQLARPVCATDPTANERLAKITAQADREPTRPLLGAESDKYLDMQLADALGLKPSDVRLTWEKESEIRLNRPVKSAVNGRSFTLDQVIFLKGASFSRAHDGGWCNYVMPPPRLTGTWQWRTALIVILSLLSMLPLAWIFARRLSRPIRTFGTAADRIGRDIRAPLLAETGPKEVRIATRALNEMQGRIQRQLKERETMIAAIAHDLRTPLARIAFRAQAAPDSVRDPIQRDIEQMDEMIAATIEYSGEQADADTFMPVSLTSVLSDLADKERTMGHSIELAAAAPSDTVIMGDLIGLERLFQNLIDNARKFGPPARIKVTRDGDNVHVTIADQGPGIPDDHIEDMFAPFTRGEPSRNRSSGGTGLGLSIVRKIVERHSGSVKLENQADRGIVVTVILPAIF